MEISIKKFDELTINELFDVARARMNIFAIEQNIKEEDLDDRDKFAYHVMLWEDKELLAYCRILPKGLMFEEIALSRVITVKEHRGKNYGAYVVDKALNFIDSVLEEKRVKISAQEQAIGFYEKHGFVRNGEIYVEAGIRHTKMIKKF